jgi:uncharacterized membrane protein
MSSPEKEYWRANIRLVGGCLLFSQQGSIFTFLVLIFFYALRMNTLDRRYGVDED